MSLYNMMCGNNPLFGLFARILEAEAPLPYVPRFRDAYLVDGAHGPEVVIYTRTGGGNREEFEEENRALAGHPLYLRDWDDDFDSTFAHFAFAVPAKHRGQVDSIRKLTDGWAKFLTPREKFDRSMSALKGPGDSGEEDAESTTDDQLRLERLGALLDELSAALPEPSSLEISLMQVTR